MGDVLEYLIDGTSGLAPGSVDGSALICGVCSKGDVGKAYLIGQSSDIGSMLGVGPLVDKLSDMLLTAGQDVTILAVPCAGSAGAYISDPIIVGVSPDCSISGYAQRNADIVVKVATGGQIGVATVSISFDGGLTFGTAQASSKTIVLGTGSDATGASLVFDDDTALLVLDTTYSITVRTAIGPVYQVGESSADISISGEVTAAAQISLVIVSGGGRNEATYQLSIDGGDNYDTVRTVPYDGEYYLDNYGVTLEFADGDYVGGTTYSCNLLAPEPSIVSVMEALETPLSLYDVEFIYVAAPSDSVDWAAAQVKADELWNLHRPTYFKMEARLPYDNEDLNDYVAYLQAERQEFSGRFVQVIAQFGEVTDSSGYSHYRSFAGLQAGRVMNIPVQRATGRVRDGAISGVSLVDGWEAVQSTLESSAYVTAKKYAGLTGVYWGDSRTMADATSDYQYEEVLRVTFKAVRLLRIAALKSMYDEAGDTLVSDDALGLLFLKGNLENALDTMVKAIPTELIGYVVNIPSGQDIVNNGVSVEFTLIGVPIIREIKLYGNYVYAGSTFDPRLED